ncbi:MAG: prolyl-tRNA synthetase associated domain-containing protein [Candidatus Latescibacterota bacterium]|nr:MAG: prolyl-tRNA synthetase associated domain-containing protein [Candidatus Latescibacterota bacterium]
MDIYRFLDEHDIEYERHDHPPVFTCEEAERLVPPMPGARTKNLFVYNKKEERHFLVVVECETVVDLKSLAAKLSVNKLALASQERLKRFLDLDPGAVTILGLVNDVGGDVEVIMDEELWESDSFRCHPLVNTSSLVIAREDIKRFIDITGHRVRILDIPRKG